MPGNRVGFFLILAGLGFCSADAGASRDGSDGSAACLGLGAGAGAATSSTGAFAPPAPPSKASITFGVGVLPAILSSQIRDKTLDQSRIVLGAVTFWCIVEDAHALPRSLAKLDVAADGIHDLVFSEIALKLA